MGSELEVALRRGSSEYADRAEGKGWLYARQFEILCINLLTDTLLFTFNFPPSSVVVFTVVG